LTAPIQTDYLLIGAGVAGLRAAIELAPHGRVLVVAKDSLKESSSEYAQGGIACALAEDDSPELHLADTLVAGDGLCDEQAVRVLVEGGPAEIHRLIDWGASFDTEDGRLLFAREGAHSRSRVLHAEGDSTGRALARCLYQQAARLAGVEFRSFAAVVDLMVAGGRVRGAWVLDGERRIGIEAKAVLLATGGLGCVYADTTNPDVATGDGVAMAYRAGAAIMDLEFVQFHPTALRLEGAPRFLLSEALRGEGARLLNSKGERFMLARHPLAELAPRDVVSRCIFEEALREGSPHVWLDLSHRGGDFVRRRFPRIHATCLRYGIDLDQSPAPVMPAAHYAMGGVRTGLDGRTTLEGLWAAGEAACTGVHGANRLASNSLLEGVVFGARAARSMAAAPTAPGRADAPPLWVPSVSSEDLRRLATRHCGILRAAAGLEDLLAQLAALPGAPCHHPSREQLETANRHTVLRLAARAALARRESRGAHRRIDYPETLGSFRKHSLQRLGEEEVSFA